MRNLKIQALVFVLGIVAGLFFSFILAPVFSPAVITPVFSPENGDEIIYLIDSAQQSIDIEMYVFTSDEILAALERASSRGVRARLILEKRVISDDNERIFNELLSHGIIARWASEEYKLTHAKFIIVDGKLLLVGSHNFSNSAMYKNREASVIISDQKTVKEFIKVFEEDWVKAD